MKIQGIQTSMDGSRLQAVNATDRIISINNASSIDQLSQSIVSKLVLSEDFYQDTGFPCALLTVKVSKF